MSSDELGPYKLAQWRASPPLMVRELFSAEPDRWQLEALEAFASPDPKKKRIAMKACAGPGKSTVEAWCAWNFLLCYHEKDHHPNALAISITGENLRDNLWKELAVWRGRSQLLQRAFEQTTERIFQRSFPQTWWLSARSFPKTADAEVLGRTLSGLHAKYMAYFVDETGDMPPAVLRAAEQGLGGAEGTWAKILQAGNTTSQLGALYAAANVQRHLWHVITITADPDDPARTPRVSLEWAREQIALYGRDNPWVMAFILGQFPPTAINALLGVDDMERAMRRGLKPGDYEHVQKRIGVDVARFGDDRTVFFPRQGLRALNPKVLRHQNGPQIAAALAVSKSRFGSELELIDDTGGWAASAIDAAQLAGLEIMPVNVSLPATDVRYFNLRSEINFLAAEWVKSGGALPPGFPELVREACAVTYYFDKGKLRVTEKAQIKAQLGVSPDLWDAFCLTFALPDMPSRVSQLLGGVGQQLLAAGAGLQANQLATEWDPFSAEHSGQ